LASDSASDPISFFRRGDDAGVSLRRRRGSFRCDGFRVRVPKISLPFRFIFAYNPSANPDITDPRVLSTERRTAVRFSIGRTF
jgi:hypothetical protein